MSGHQGGGWRRGHPPAETLLKHIQSWGCCSAQPKEERTQVGLKNGTFLIVPAHKRDPEAQQFQAPHLEGDFKKVGVRLFPRAWRARTGE